MSFYFWGILVCVLKFFWGFWFFFVSVHNKLPNIMTLTAKQQYTQTAEKFKMDTQEHLTVHE